MKKTLLNMFFYICILLLFLSFVYSIYLAARTDDAIDYLNRTQKYQSFGKVISAKTIKSSFWGNATCEIEAERAIINLLGECNLVTNEPLIVRKHYFNKNNFTWKKSEE